jgi:succinate dehydrogenase / fumarate reductase, membrane anchor subunit
MGYMTDRKRAIGAGSARAGTHHHWSMTLSSAALAILIPLFIITFGSMLGQSHDAVMEYYSRPFPALVAGLTIAIGFHHFRGGVQVLLEDYVHGGKRKFAIVAMTCISYAAAATGIFALLRIAL